MTGGPEGRHRAIFILRLHVGDDDRVRGVVERVLTGEKAWVEALEDVAEVLAAMLAPEDAQPSA
jgi:hypothetical protein